MVERARLVVLVDNRAIEPLEPAWGLAVYLEAEGTRVLFDTGPEPVVLERNSELLRTRLNDLDFVFLSHEHADHVGGLPYVADLNPGLEVYIPAGASKSLRRWIEDLGLRAVCVRGVREISEGIYSSGEVCSGICEHALVVRTRGGLLVLTGCAHPGVRPLIERARALDKRVLMLLGGLHLAGAGLTELESVARYMAEIEIDTVLPLHCSGDRAVTYLARRLASTCGRGFAGLAVEVSERGVRTGRWI